MRRHSLLLLVAVSGGVATQASAIQEPDPLTAREAVRYVSAYLVQLREQPPASSPETVRFLIRDYRIDRTEFVDRASVQSALSGCRLSAPLRAHRGYAGRPFVRSEWRCPATNPLGPRVRGEFVVDASGMRQVALEAGRRGSPSVFTPK